MKKRSDGRYQKKVKLPNGKTKILYSSAPNEREANKDFNKQMFAVVESEKNKTKFCSVSDAWASIHFPLLEETTIKGYKPAIKGANDYFADFYIEEIESNDVCAYRDHLIRQGYAYKTVKNRMLVLNLIMTYALIDRKLIPLNPCQSVKVPKGLPKKKRQAQTVDETELIIKNTDTPFGVLAYFFLFTGCRRGEAFALKPSDVNLKNKTVKIHNTVIWIGNQPKVKPYPKTDAGNRDIPLPDKVIALIKPYMKQEYLFQNEKGEIYTNSQITRALKKYQNDTGVTATPHQLRHGYATLLFDAGIDVKTAQKWLGHADTTTTLEIYTHLSEMKKAQSTDKLHEYINTNF